MSLSQQSQTESPQDRYLDPSHRHDSHRSVLRMVGPIVFGIGLIFTIVGFVGFFQTANNFGHGFVGSQSMPNGFGSHGLQFGTTGGGAFGNTWCLFIGLPLMGVGLMIIKFAYFGAVARYIANEAAPVAGDTINYLGESTQPGVRAFTNAVTSGLRGTLLADDDNESGGGSTGSAIRCPACHHVNDADAKFCDHCGKPLTQACPACGQANDPDARFCDHCGKPLI